MRLLLVEDEIRMAQALIEILKAEKYDVDYYEDGELGLSAIESGIYDVVILDVMLPKMDGFTVLKKAREKGISTPVLLLTAKADIDDKVEGFESGADDYLTKPFLAKELLVRVKALIRRGKKNLDISLSYGDISIDSDTLVLSSSDNSVRLSEKEFKILEYLIINKGRIITREQLAIKIWGYDFDGEYNNVEVYMTFVRKKLAYVKAKTIIKAIRGAGYTLQYGNV